METMRINSWGETYELAVQITKYVYGDGLAIQLFCVENGNITEPYATLTVNLSDYPTNESCAYVDTNNFPEAMGLISRYHLGTPTGEFGFSGFCMYPEVRFDLDELKKYSID